MQSYSIYIPRRMRNFRLHHQMSKNPSQSTNLKTCRTKGNKKLTWGPQHYRTCRKKKKSRSCSCCFSKRWFCPFSPSIGSTKNCSRHAIGRAVVGLLRLKSLQIFIVWLESANFSKPQNAGIFAASDLHPKKKAMTQLVVFGVRVWSFILKRFST